MFDLKQVLGIAPKLSDLLGVQDVSTAYNQAQPTIIHGQEIPGRMTPQGMIVKGDNGYASLGVQGAIGSMSNMAKEAKVPLLKIGENIYKNLPKNSARGWIDWAERTGTKWKLGK